jgi:succinoglycan biosynthesis transport protein ExoP
VSKTNDSVPRGTPSPESRRALSPLVSSSLQPRPPRPRLRQGAESQEGITPHFVVSAMRQWWKVAVPVGVLLAAGLGALVYLTFKPVYEASAWLEIKDRAPYIAFPDRSGSGSFIRTQLALIHSPLVLGPVVSNPEIAGLPEVADAEDPMEFLGKHIKVIQEGDSEIFRISYAGRDAANTKKVVDAVVDEYFRLRGGTDAERTESVIKLLEAQRDLRAREVDRLRENVRVLTKQATGKDPFAANPAAEIVVQHPLAALQGRLTAAVVEQEILKARIKAFEDSVAKQQVDVPEAMVANAIEASAEVRAREAELAAKRSKLQEFKTKLVRGDQDPSYVQLAEEIKRGEQSLGEARQQVRQEIGGRLEAVVAASRKDEVANLQSQLQSYQLVEELLQKRCDQERKEMETASGESLELEFARADLDRAENVFRLIAERVVQLRTEQGAPARVEPLQAATVPTAPVESFPFKRIALAVLASLCLPFGLAVVWERMIRRVTDAEQIEEHSNLGVVGEVARLPVRGRVLTESSSKRIGRNLGVFEESIDILRTCLVLSEPLRDMKVLAVTSAANREGKTSVAVQLAVSIARASGEPTLLIDGDMRAPDVHNVLDGSLEPGLGDVLAGKCSLRDAIVTSWSENLHFLPAGKAHASPHKLLGNGVVGPLFEEVRNSYRYIIVDTPPVLAAGEALVLASAADASLICAMRDRSRLDQLKRAQARLLAAGARPVGIVLNGVPIRRYLYRYGDYSYNRG